MSNGNSTLPAANSLVVGITGHRKLRKSELPALRAQVKAFLQDLQARYPELPLVLLSSLAEGSDQLAAEVALDLGLRVIAPLPIPVELYRDDFDAPSRSDRAGTGFHRGVRHPYRSHRGRAGRARTRCGRHAVAASQ